MIVKLNGNFEPLLRYPSAERENQESYKELKTLSGLGGVKKLAFFIEHDRGDQIEVLRNLSTSFKEDFFWVNPFLVKSDGRRFIGSFTQALETGVLGVSQGYKPFESTNELRQVLEYASSHDLLVHSAPFDKLNFGNSMAFESALATEFGFPACPRYAEYFNVYRDVELAKLTGAEILIGPVVLEESVEIIRNAKKNGYPVKAFTSLPYVLFSYENLVGYSSSYKVMPPLSSEKDQIALINALKDSSIDFLNTGHEAVNRLAKDRELDMAESGISTMGFAMHSQFWLAEKYKLDIHEINSWMSDRVLEALKIKHRLPAVEFDSKATFSIEDYCKKFKSKNFPKWFDTFQGKVIQN